MAKKSQSNTKTYIITGPPGAGKSTLSSALAGTFDKGLHLHCDDIYNMVKGGYKAPWDDTDDFLKNLMFQASHKIIQHYRSEGFSCVVDYVFRFEQLCKFISDLSGKIVLKVLMIPIKLNIEQDRNRQWVVGDDRVRLYHNEFSEEPRFQPYLMDHSNSQIEQVAKEITGDPGLEAAELLRLLA